MRKLLLCSALVFPSLWLATPAQACDNILTNPGPDASCIMLWHQGRRGTWFDLATANKMTRAFQLEKELRYEISMHMKAGALYQQESLNMQKALKLKDHQTETLLEALAKQERLTEEAKAKLSASENKMNPVFWALVVALAGFALVGGVCIAL